MCEKFVEEMVVEHSASSTTEGMSGASRAGAERIFTEVMSDLSGVEQVLVDSHFFDDLGVDSLMMARFCARIRKRGDLPPVSMKDVYQHPTIRSLAAALTDRAPAAVEPPASAPSEVAANPNRATTRQHVLCGALQLLFMIGFAFLAALVIEWAFEWISAGAGVLEIYLRSVAVGATSFGGLCVLSIVAKWVLIGRWKRQEIQVWSLAYFRFWIVKTLVQRNPMVLFVGTPLYAFFLRTLGAKIGRGVVILSRNVPVCTDLLSIGDGAVVRKDSFFNGYRATNGVVETGAVTLGEDVLVGEATVLDIETSMGDGAQLGHSSSLHAGQVLPAAERWHGVPAQPTETDYRTVPPVRMSRLRRVAYPMLQLVVMFGLSLPLVFGGVVMLFTEVPRAALLLEPDNLALTNWVFYADVVVASFVVFFGVALAGLVAVAILPRVLALAIKPDKVYRLYGFHYALHRAIRGLTNRQFFVTLFGDSSAIVHYLRWVGYDLSKAEQTGSNFGLDVKHDSPFLSSVGRGTMVADGLSLINADYSSTSFRVSRASIGAHNFLGNKIAYPAQGKTGDNCLLATKVMVPIDGPVRENVGLLGSPPFEIPRSVERDTRFDHLRSGEELRRGLAGKNKHNAVTASMFLLIRWIHFFGIVLFYAVAADLFPELGAVAIALANLFVVGFSVGHFILVERASMGFRPLRPLYCSIYDIAFWRHERFWKMSTTAFAQAFNGTPFKGVILRLLGVRIGRRFYDDGSIIVEKTLVTIGEDCMLNAGTQIQAHSQEDGAFKSDQITIGSGCTIGVGSFVLYGVVVGDGAELAPDSFLMKGEEVPPHEKWAGNPAKKMQVRPARVDDHRSGLDDNRSAVLVHGD